MDPLFHSNPTGTPFTADCPEPAQQQCFECREDLSDVVVTERVCCCLNTYPYSLPRDGGMEILIESAEACQSLCPIAYSTVAVCMSSLSFTAHPTVPHPGTLLTSDKQLAEPRCRHNQVKNNRRSAIEATNTWKRGDRKRLGVFSPGVNVGLPSSRRLGVQGAVYSSLPGTGLAHRFDQGTLMPGTGLVPWVAFCRTNRCLVFTLLRTTQYASHSSFQQPVVRKCLQHESRYFRHR